MKGHITLILGGARSGKSTTAERLPRSADRVLFVATAQALDDEMKRRIRIHRRSRPAAWDTLEAPRELVSVLQPRLAHYDVFLLDLMQGSDAAWILVSNEVGSGIVPASPLGRVYRDVLGQVNQMIAAHSNRVLLMVAGLAFEAPLPPE